MGDRLSVAGGFIGDCLFPTGMFLMGLLGVGVLVVGGFTGDFLTGTGTFLVGGFMGFTGICLFGGGFIGFTGNCFFGGFMGLFGIWTGFVGAGRFTGHRLRPLRGLIFLLGE